ncbi:tRNA glutamyl-Q(34) synthetase GluQRS [Aliikangiella coralliicola]|uniref:Glutamyl-Q tRNA(Asp) synthetase n=1 Tax=Aliikangiella coralliicola TaxID=2592383 RepID=A0A545UE06_9GAMM|nr:tRNA glutamyl-Q(34) synthetase GluQRS [Aliikangiella coralliicola]TQV87696.1 tRNA glutamyl-Q(34) synthetase GluQRS [Aliikangiella coralliicola]
MASVSAGQQNLNWIGRFAPTPSGPLHFGSLVAAVGSYCVARHKNGLWLLRIEDLDPPREVAGAATEILKTLEAFGFEWDREVCYQSKQQNHYRAALEQLENQKVTYRCDCSRKLVLQRNSGVYDSYCRSRALDNGVESATRIRFESGYESFEDRILGKCCFERPADTQDFVVQRRDGLFAYQLAVVVDDIEQNVNHVVRGADILDSTPRQNYLYHCLKVAPPSYYHLPLVVDAQGEKFSKSRFSPSIKCEQASRWLVEALCHLGQKVDQNLISATPPEILDWAITHWRTSDVGTKARVFSALKT